MAMAVGGANRGTFVEVNIVPLIDILLVLLVIFMIIPHQRTGLQADYDLRRARYEKARTIEREVEPLAALQPVIA